MFAQLIAEVVQLHVVTVVLSNREKRIPNLLECRVDVGTVLRLKHPKLPDFDIPNGVFETIGVENDQEIHSLETKPIVPIVDNKVCARERVWTKRRTGLNHVKKHATSPEVLAVIKILHSQLESDQQEAKAMRLFRKPGDRRSR
jgi:hypothetical protein